MASTLFVGSVFAEVTNTSESKGLRVSNLHFTSHQVQSRLLSLSRLCPRTPSISFTMTLNLIFFRFSPCRSQLKASHNSDSLVRVSMMTTYVQISLRRSMRSRSRVSSLAPYSACSHPQSSTSLSLRMKVTTIATLRR